MSAFDDMQQSAADDAPIEIVSSLTRAGRPFLPVAELAVLPSLRTAATRLPAHRSGSQLILLPECPLPVGVPDLVALVASVPVLATRASAGIEPLLGEQEARLAAACGVARAASLERLAALAGVSESHARRIVRGLERKGAIERTELGWLRSPALLPVGRIYAIEAKVSESRAGLSQCLRYATLADAAALALGRLGDRSRERVITFGREHGLGVFTDDRWLVRPRISHHSLGRRLWVSEHLIAAIGTS